MNWRTVKIVKYQIFYCDYCIKLSYFNFYYGNLWSPHKVGNPNKKAADIIYYVGMELFVEKATIW